MGNDLSPGEQSGGLSSSNIENNNNIINHNYKGEHQNNNNNKNNNNNNFINNDFEEDDESSVDYMMGGSSSSVDIEKEENLPKNILENDEKYKQLRDFLLSGRSSTEKNDEVEEVVEELKPDVISQLLADNVEGISNMYDRTGSMPVTEYIKSTYTNGLPLFAGNEAVKQHTIKALRFILFKASKLPEKFRKPTLRRLAEAFTACQMEQGRVIDSLYGSLSGRDKGFEEQVLSMVDIQKEQVLNQLVNHYNPNAWKTGDEHPSKQVPHLQSSYCVAIGTDFGIRGVKAAKLDKDAPSVSSKGKENLKRAYQSLFSVQDLIKTFVADVNQQDSDDERLIKRESLTSWAGEKSMNNGFPSHSIFYDEDNAKDWPEELGKPKQENKYQPFLNDKVALNILNHLFANNFNKE